MSQVWVIGAGKGGVGKTFLTSSLGITISKLDKSVLMIDLDFGSANLHTALGCPHSEKNLNQFWSGKSRLTDLVLPTDLPRLSYIQGHWDQWEPVRLDLQNLSRLLEEVRQLRYDYILFDLGPGATEFHLELFQQADVKILASTPEPTAIEKNYRFIESFLAWKLKTHSTPEAYQKLLAALLDYRKAHAGASFSFRNYLESAVGFEIDLFDQLDEKPVCLLMNQCRSPQDEQLGYSIQSVCRKFYDIPLDYIGGIEFDNAVWQSVRARRPVLIDKPFTPLAGQFLSIAKDLTTTNFVSKFLKAVV